MKNVLTKIALVFTLLCPLLGTAADKKDNELSLASYNIWAFAIGSAEKISERLEAIPAHLPDVDVLALQEVFEPVNSDKLLNNLKDTWPYVTDDPWELGKVLASGVRILSKWPITEQHFQPYKACAGVDCFANKGVSYAKIMKGDTPYHVFATHTQSGDSDSEREARAKQIVELNRFVYVIYPPKGEAVIYAGDFNTDKIGRYDDYQALLKTLSVENYDSTGHPFTYDTQTNQWVTSDEQAYYDYVFYSKRHKKPVSISHQVLTPKQDDMDLSDHYLVKSLMTYPK